jgi:hypothetical protein
MGEPAKSTLVEVIERKILEIFEVSPSSALRNAEGLAEMAETWGGQGVITLDWDYHVKKWFGEELPWRSEAGRQRWRAAQQVSTGAYETYLREQNNPKKPAPPDPMDSAKL